MKMYVLHMTTNTGEDDIKVFVSKEVMKNYIRNDVETVVRLLQEDKYEPRVLKKNEGYEIYVADSDIYYEWKFFEKDLQEEVSIKPYLVILSNCGNPDHLQNPHETLFGVPIGVAQASSIAECQERVRDYIEKYDLGSGNWSGGEVFDLQDGRLLGQISYNGKFWEFTNI